MVGGTENGIVHLLVDACVDTWHAPRASEPYFRSSHKRQPKLPQLIQIYARTIVVGKQKLKIRNFARSAS